MCSAHNNRLARYGDPNGGVAFRGQALSLIREVVSNPPNECAIWPLTLTTAGYGKVYYEGRTTVASRVALCLFTGVSIETALFALHGPCHNPACFNPMHLYWGSCKDNCMDQLRDGTRIHGENMKNAKLNNEDVLAIYSSQCSGVEAARRFGVSKSTVSAIRSGRAWRRVTGHQAKYLEVTDAS